MIDKKIIENLGADGKELSDLLARLFTENNKRDHQKIEQKLYYIERNYDIATYVQCVVLYEDVKLVAGRKNEYRH